MLVDVPSFVSESCSHTRRLSVSKFPPPPLRNLDRPWFRFISSSRSFRRCSHWWGWGCGLPSSPLCPVTFIRAISTLGCPDLSLDAVGRLVSENGLDAAEIRCLEGRTDLPALFRERFGQPEDLAYYVREHRIPITSLSTSFHLYGHEAKDQDELLEFVPWAEALGLKRLRVFDGGGTASDAEYAGIASTLNWWNNLRSSNRWTVDLMVETHDMLYTSERIKRFYAASPGAALLWDTHHTWRKGGEDPLATWSAVGPGVCHIHVKDSVGISDGRNPYTYVLPGDGEFAMSPLLNRLKIDRFTGPVSLEWEKRWIPTLPPLEEALSRARTTAWW